MSGQKNYNIDQFTEKLQIRKKKTCVTYTYFKLKIITPYFQILNDQHTSARVPQINQGAP